MHECTSRRDGFIHSSFVSFGPDRRGAHAVGERRKAKQCHRLTSLRDYARTQNENCTVVRVHRLGKMYHSLVVFPKLTMLAGGFGERALSSNRWLFISPSNQSACVGTKHSGDNLTISYSLVFAVSGREFGRHNVYLEASM